MGEVLFGVKTVLRHPWGEVNVNSLSRGIREISVHPFDKSMFTPRSSCKTRYPLRLIRKVLEIKGPAYLCDEIARDEDPTYLQPGLEKSILGFVPGNRFEGKELLDFGCGSGASTMVLARILPKTRIIGLDLNPKLLKIAKLRAQHYGFHTVRFMQSPNPDSIPHEIGNFDFLTLNAVYEHLLPRERKSLVPQLWAHLRLGGILFINETPNRLSPIEYHTTGLPAINYLPDPIAFALARRFSPRVRSGDSWEVLLRNGIRGSTTKEILRIIQKIGRSNLKLLDPLPFVPRKLNAQRNVGGVSRVAEGTVTLNRMQLIMKPTNLFLSDLRRVTRILDPLSLAIQKRNGTP